MSTTAQQQRASSSSTAHPDADSAPTTLGRHGRARHARTNASLTSSSGSVGITSPTFPRRTSAPNEATRIFQATGFDPFSTEPDTLFRLLTVKEVDAYERAVRSTALGKQEELRSLVGQRYEDLLGTATTVIDMAGSSEQLSERLQKLAEGVTSAAVTEEQGPSSPKASRRKSYLPAQKSTTAPDSDASSLHREAIYVLGASLRLIMDAPEYVWKSIEKGKTLQAAWAFLLTRATWLDLIESRSQSALAKDGEAGISSVAQAVSLLKVNVKKAFPFIEKQWQTMLPMRKQIVARAVSLLSDTEIESMAVVDQLAALMLIDGSRLDQAKQLLLSQRLTGMHRMIQRRRTKPDSHLRNESAAPIKDDRAAQISQTIAQLVTLFARTLQHAVQAFTLPPKADSSTSTKPLLLDLVRTITDPDNLVSGQPAASPAAERTLLFPHSASNGDVRQSAAALRALRRRSNHGLPIAEESAQPDSAATADRTPITQRQLRVSTVSVVDALPSGKILSRLLPASFWSFTPSLNLGSTTSHSQEDLADLSNWAAKARESIVLGTDSKSVTLRTINSDLSDVSDLALVRRSLRIASQRARRTISRKLTLSPSAEQAVTHIHTELQRLEEAIDAILQERLLELAEGKLSVAVQELLRRTKESVVAIAAVQVASPLDDLFKPIDAELASNNTLQAHVTGRSNQVDNLARLYEDPLATLTADLEVYMAELGERFVSAASSIRDKFEGITAASRGDIERGLDAMLDQPDERANLLVMRVIAVLAGPNAPQRPRPSVLAALEKCWRPSVERRLSQMLSAPASAESPSDAVSESMLSALAMLAESIVQLGPAMAGLELAQLVRTILTSLTTSSAVSKPDAAALSALLSCDASGLSTHISADAGLHRVRLALTPLLLALSLTAAGSATQVISPAEPVTTTHNVQPIIALSRRQVERFSPLPVR
ncbi:hypothetical protein PSEUBRA_002559 [Kalmanozyma brasiliensis GHG001]|uniref:uncharacterized protein n=1 Tax=Kalmanozyma brasiliensis (strain GHG001) TaxID=1365824 RepID=UPI002867BB25|nr:uncharacterized protein PSEUBRA_002559 [Kalmanozyma brasiliensis GHG001]EST07481.2 hypothetical protein PSEUBRA_002559 [Kalmanozyma brasiliensis GHG001]